MAFSIKQINDLITGNRLVAELSAVSPSNRRFLLVTGYELNVRGKPCKPSKMLNSKKAETLLFEVKDYEVPTEYIEKNWDCTEDDLVSYEVVDGIVGITALVQEVSKHMNDISLLVPEWKTDSPI